MSQMRNLVYGLAVVFALTLFVSLPAHANDRTFEITNVEINAYINEQGDMKVTELDTYEFRGAFNGILVLLDESGSDGIVDFQAFEITADNEVPLRVERYDAGRQTEYRVYSQSNDETKTFKLTYTVNNVVKVYEDTAELYWQFFDDSNENNLNNVRISVELAFGVTKDEVQAFGHGPLHGTLEINDTNGVIDYFISPLPAGEMLEVRVLFPERHVPASTNIIAETAHDKIMDEELSWADESDKQRADEQRRQQNMWRNLIYIGIALLGTNIGILIAIYRKYDKEHKPDWDGKYFRELPADLTPAVASYLMDYQVENRDMVATLMDLIRKKYVDLQVETKEAGLFKRKQTDYIFRLLNNDSGGLRGHEQDLIDWFFVQIGKGNEVSLSEIKKYAASRRQAVQFVKRLDNWNSLVVSEAESLGYFESTAYAKSWAFGIALVQIIGILVFAPGLYKLLAVTALPLFLYAFAIRRRTPAGATELAKWQALKRYLNDYSKLADKEPMAIHLWEHFLVYAISLGVAKKIIDITNIDVRQMEQTTNYPVYTAMTHGGLHRQFDHFTNSINSTVAAARSNSQSSSSSRGSGGGFSSGGGGGGGGGGRGAF